MATSETLQAGKISLIYNDLIRDDTEMQQHLTYS